MLGRIRQLFKDNGKEKVQKTPDFPELTTEELQRMFDSNAAVQEVKNQAANYIHLEMRNNRDITQKNSKIGGVGYLPKTMAYPRNNGGVPLSLLAQINFAEIPNLEGYPTEGILAIYIDYSDDVWGINLDNSRNNAGFRVLYFEDVDVKSYSVAEIKRIFEYVDQSEWIPVVSQEKRLIGRLEQDYLFASRDAFEEVFESTLDNFLYEQFGKYGDMMIDYVGGTYWPEGHKIGGYPLFNQDDPRIDNKYDKLLFQLDSDTIKGVVMWADSGTGHFFISEQDLKNRKFDDVHYSWDSL